MNLQPISILCFFITFSLCRNHQPHFTGDVSVNCGSTGVSTARNGRQWLGDVRRKLSPTLQLGGSSAASTAVGTSTTADQVPYETARISGSQFSYSFQLSPGQKIIRLHFNPTPYRCFKGFSDFFTVKAGNFILLANFSALLTAHALGVDTFVKEYCLNIEENQALTITFSPESNQLIDTYAFVNGIEIISVPPNLSYFDSGDIGLRVVGEKFPVFFDRNAALEIIHQLHIKPDSVPKWATQRAVEVRNKKWKMPVEVGFRYLIRLHLSKVGLKIVVADDLVFKILINDVIVYTDTDVVNGKDQYYTGLYRDYMVVMRGCKQSGRRDILISFQSSDELEYGYEILEGFEIVKLSNADDNLASPNPLPLPQDSQSHKLQYLLSILNHPIASGTVAFTVLSLLCIIVHKLRESGEANSTEEEHKLSANAERHCRRFSLAEIESATRSFNEGLVIGRGGFGRVYKGLIDKGEITVAIKRLKSYSTQGECEFLTEIETLSEVRHMNLVPLIGYCKEGSEMILVYEYMSGGTLADHLYKLGTDCSPLNWKQRLNICIGAARGLDYLHTGRCIIHRDVKASNFLLDECFTAKVSDFGLAKTEDRSKLHSHIITKVKGSWGYMDPYYHKTGKLTRKSDVYSFGVVLLEVLCGRPASEFGFLLSSWALDKIRKGEVDEIVASIMREEISPNSLKSFVEVAVRCLHDEPKHRPTMSQIVMKLESALELQENNQKFVTTEAAIISADIHPIHRDRVDQSGTLQLTMANEESSNAAVRTKVISCQKGRIKRERSKRWMAWPSWKRNASKQVRKKLALSRDPKCRLKGPFGYLDLEYDNIFGVVLNAGPPIITEKIWNVQWFFKNGEVENVIDIKIDPQFLKEIIEIGVAWLNVKGSEGTATRDVIRRLQEAAGIA